MAQGTQGAQNAVQCLWAKMGQKIPQGKPKEKNVGGGGGSSGRCDPATVHLIPKQQLTFTLTLCFSCYFFLFFFSAWAMLQKSILQKHKHLHQQTMSNVLVQLLFQKKKKAVQCSEMHCLLIFNNFPSYNHHLPIPYLILFIRFFHEQFGPTTCNPQSSLPWHSRWVRATRDPRSNERRNLEKCKQKKKPNQM